MVAVRSLPPDDDLGSSSSSIQGVGHGPGGSGTDLGSVAVCDDVSLIGDVARVGGPDTVRVRVRVRVRVIAREGSMAGLGWNGWMDGWIKNLMQLMIRVPKM